MLSSSRQTTIATVPAAGSVVVSASSDRGRGCRSLSCASAQRRPIRTGPELGDSGLGCLSLVKRPLASRRVSVDAICEATVDRRRFAALGD